MATLNTTNIKHASSSANNIVLASDGGITFEKPPAKGRQVLEQFYTPCDGSTITTSAGDITVGNVTAAQASTSTYAQLTGSSISYTPPSGTTQVIYEFDFHYMWIDNRPISHFRLSIGGTEVSDARTTYEAENKLTGRFSIKWGFNIGGSTTAATGRQATWTSAKTIMLEYRDYSSSYNSQVHHNSYWDGSSGGVVKPCIGITAIGGTA